MAKNIHLRYEHLAKELISHLLGFEEASDEFKRSFKYVMSNFLYHQCLDVNSHNVERTLQGISFKMEIHGHQNKAKRLMISARKFLSSPYLEDKGDLKWSLLHLLLDLGYHPAREDLSESFEALEVSSRAQELATEWFSEATETPPFQWLDKDDTLSEWSDVDEDSNLSEMLRSQEKSFHEFQDLEPSLLSSANYEFIRDARRQLAEEIQPCVWSKASESLAISNSKESPAATVLTEYVVMRECLWILMQPCSGCLFKENDDGFAVQPIAISSLSQECIQNMVKPIARAASQLRNLDSWMSEGLSSKIMNGTLKAYLDALVNWRHEFRNQLLFIEKDVMDGENSPSLLWLMSQLEGPLRRLSILHSIHSKALQVPNRKQTHSALLLLGLLVEHGDGSLSLGDRRPLLSVLVKTLSFLLNALESWLWGPHNLPFDQFGIKELSGQDAGTSTSAKYQTNEIIHEIGGLEFLRSMQDPLIEVAHLKGLLKNLDPESLFGKKKNLECLLASAIFPQLNQIQEIPLETSCAEKKTPDPSLQGNQDVPFEYPDPFLKMAFEFDSISGLDSTKSPSNDPLDRSSIPISCKVSNVLVQILVPLLEEYSARAGHQLMALLKQKYSLTAHLKLFKAASLLEPGDLIADFYSYLYSQIDGRERVDASDLTLSLRYSLEDFSSQLARNLSLSLDVSRSIADQSGMFNYSNDLLSSIKINYKADWPVNLILNEEIVAKYSKLFSFCLTIKKAVVALENLHFRELGSFEALYEPKDDLASLDEIDPSSPLGLFPPKEVEKAELPLGQRVHRLQLLKHWLLFFAKTLYNHFNVAILTPFSCKVDALIQQPCHFDYFIKEHAALLEITLHDCLLSEKKSSPIRNVFNQIFRTIDETRRLWRGNPENITNNALESLEESYASCHRFLAHFFSTISQRRFCPLIERLSETLADNCPI